MDGILNINKSSGTTSFGVVHRLRGILKTRKIGHAGTLDPDATGVLPVCIGKATKVIEFLMEKDKAYRAVLKLGVETDTQDASGNILAVRAVNSSDQEIKEAVGSFVGEIMQIPPMYSAIRVDGKRLYELARKGLEIERKPRPVTIHSIENLEIKRTDESVLVVFDVSCSKGTYIRTLCADIGSRLGCGGHMESLIRTSVGPFLLEDAITLETVQERVDDDSLQEVMIGMDIALAEYSPFTADEKQAKRLRNGVPVPCPPSLGKAGDIIRIYHENGDFIAIGSIVGQAGKLLIKSCKWLGGH